MNLDFNKDLFICDNNDNNEIWLNEFIKEEKHYDLFYKDNLSYVNLYFLYVDCFNELESIKQEKYFFKKYNTNTNNYDMLSTIKLNILNKNDLIQIIHKNNSLNNTKYILKTLLKYNYDIEHIDVLKTYNIQHLISEKIQNIHFNDTIKFFENVNCLFFIFEKKLILGTNKIIHKNINKKYTHKNKMKMKMKMLPVHQ